MNEPNRKVVKRYFVGRSQTGPIVLMLVGLFTMALVVGIFLLLGGIIWFLYNKFSVDHEGESEVDKAKEHEIALTKERALKKLNILEDQVSDVDPVVVSGRGTEPASSGLVIKTSFLKKLLKRKKKNEDVEDPIYRVKIGSDDKFRCSLVSISVFMFGEKQLYIYFSQVDLATGLVYSEGTHEYFYSDINAMSFYQDKEKIFNFKKKKFERILFECVKIFASGCSYTATLSLITTVAIRVPVAYGISFLTRTPELPYGRSECIQLSLLFSWVMGAVLTAIFYKRGAWKKRALT